MHGYFLFCHMVVCTYFEMELEIDPFYYLSGTPSKPEYDCSVCPESPIYFYPKTLNVNM